MGALNRALGGAIALSAKFSKNRVSGDWPEPEISWPAGGRSDRFEAGFGSAAVLPADIEKRRYYIAGYGENNPARGVIDPQYWNALWLDDLSGEGGVLFLVMDAVGILQKDVERIRDRLRAFRLHTGCRKIIVTSTHDHAGIDTMGLWGPLPFTGRDPAFMELVFARAEAAAKAAYADRRKGRLFYGSVHVPDLQEDIRTPVVYSDLLTRFRFQPDDGSEEIWFLNFAAHCESLQGCNHLVSADYPAYLRERIREKTGAGTVFAVGAVGGMISMRVDEEDLLRREHRLLESTRRIGRRLADHAIGITQERELKPHVGYASQVFYVPVENPLLSAAALVGIIQASPFYLPEGPAVRTVTTYMEIGGLPLVFLPGELFPELVYGGALTAEDSATGTGPEVNPPILADLIGKKDFTVFGLADDEIGYVLPPNDYYLNPDQPYLEKGVDRFGRRHYEETNSAGPGAAGAIAAALARLTECVKKLKTEMGGNLDD